MLDKQFDYEKKVFGNLEVGPESRDLAGLRLKKCMGALKEVSGKVLEVGCGAGHFLRGLKIERPDITACGIDISRTSINIAKKYGDGIEYMVSSADTLPFKDESFDAVIFFDILEHLPDPASAMAEMNRVLKKNGLLHGFVPLEGQPLTFYWLLWKLRLFHRLKERHAGHIQRFTIRGVIKLMEENGFKCLSKSYSWHFSGELMDFIVFLGKDMRSRIKGDASTSPQQSSSASLRGGNNPVRWLERKWEVFRYYESVILGNLPGAGIHLTCRKNG